MQTLPLFQELANPRVVLKAAIAADVEAAGGFKEVAVRLWSEMDPSKAIQKLSNACNAKQKQELDYFDIQKVKLYAREATGSSHIHSLESKSLKCNLHWVTLQEEAQEVVVSLGDTVTRLSAEMTRAQNLLSRLAASK